MSSSNLPLSTEDVAQFSPVHSEFAIWLENELSRKKMDRAELARRANISQSTLSLIYKGERKAGKKTCVNIARALEIPELVVMEKAGIVTATKKVSPLVEQITHIVSLLPKSEQEGFLEYAELRKRLIEKGKKDN